MSSNKLRSRLDILGLALVVSMVFTTNALAGEQKIRGVVELFTSQGCSSCPPADKVLGKYAEKGDVLALSWHVDYWNYLGWKDTFSRKEFTERQQLYAGSFKRRGIYTPQAVVNGRTHVVGSHHSEIEARLLHYASAGQGLSVPVNVDRGSKSISIDANVPATLGDVTLWIVFFDRAVEVAIKRGENTGRTITYHNVVRDFGPIGMTKGGDIKVELPLVELRRKGSDSFAVLLQKNLDGDLPGPIIGASVIDELQGS